MKEQVFKIARPGINCWGYALAAPGIIDEPAWIENPTLDDLKKAGLREAEDNKKAKLVAIRESGFEWLCHALIVIGDDTAKHYQIRNPYSPLTDKITTVIDKYKQDETFREIEVHWLTL